MVRYSPVGTLSFMKHTSRMTMIAIFSALTVLSVVTLVALRPSHFTHPLHFFSSGPSPPPLNSRMCPATGPNNHYEQLYGHELLQRSIAHEGSNKRLREKIAMAQRGEDIRMAVLGGSVSAGHTLTDLSRVYYFRFLDWWNEQFPGGHHTIFPGAIGATDSGYFAYCFNKHIPKDVDIIFLEFSLNDAR